jgi:hypothetical protein
VRARAAWRKALRLAEAAGDQGSVLVLAANLGLVALERGRPREARDLADRVAALAESLGAERERVFARLLAADALLRSLELDEAERVLEGAEKGARRLGNAVLLENAAEMRAEIALARGDGAAALRWAHLGSRVTRGFPVDRAEFRLLRSRALLRLGKSTAALADARAARQEYEAAGNAAGAAVAAALAARCLRAEGRDGPERQALRALRGPARDAEVAAGAAVEATGEAARSRRSAEALRLARVPRDRREVEAILAEPVPATDPARA